MKDKPTIKFLTWRRKPNIELVAGIVVLARLQEIRSMLWQMDDMNIKMRIYRVFTD
jgi:hypothetical protein